MILILFIFYLSFISLISCGSPTFEIQEVNHISTRCDLVAGYFEFSFKGKGKNIEDPIRINLPLKSPKSSEAVCMVSSTDMFCSIDVFLYDSANPSQTVAVYEEEPIFDNLKIKNWADFFTPEKRVINHAMNCIPEERLLDPEEGDELYIFGALDKNIDMLGCKENNNTFMFQMILIKAKNQDSEISLEEDLNFEIYFKKPKDEKNTCFIPKKDKDRWLLYSKMFY